MGNIFKKEKPQKQTYVNQTLKSTIATTESAQISTKKENSPNTTRCAKLDSESIDNENIISICDKIGCSKKGRMYNNGLDCFCDEHRNTLGYLRELNLLSGLNKKQHGYDPASYDRARNPYSW